MDEQQIGKQAQTIKRRGILAAAGAVVAGIAAKQTALPVAAVANVVLGGPNTESTATTISYTATQGDIPALALHCDNSDYGFGLKATGTAYGVSGTGGQYAGIYGDTSNSTGSGVEGIARSNLGGTGVSGSCDAASGVGVLGNSYNGTGVRGEIPSGNNALNTLGVYGLNQSSGAGGVGVRGQIAASTAANTIAVFGNNLSTGANGIGVYGSSANGTGVYGQTSVSNQYGVLGTTYATNSTAIAGTCTANGSSAFSGGTTNPNAFAGVFQGTVVVQGRLIVSDPSYKSGALQHPDGSHRLVYCVESPESWIEDVGKGTLTNGRTNVTFDSDFTAVVHTDDYHVFLTEMDGTHHHLSVEKKTPTGFTVTADGEIAKLKGKQAADLAGTFSWRVMVKPKSAVKSERLGKFTMPTIPLPDTAKFKAPETPTSAAPKKP